jgi:hypothetical protein
MKNNKQKKLKQDPKLENPVSPLIGEVKNDRVSTISPSENYAQNEFDAQIDEYDTLIHFEDIFSDYTFTADYLTFELHYELEQRIKQFNLSPNSPNGLKYYAIHYLIFWQKILENLRGLLTGRQLLALNGCIGLWASESSCPYERRDEIFKVLYLSKDWFKLNHLNRDNFLDKIKQIDPLILFELAEILINSKVIYDCAMDPERSLNYPLLDNDFIIPTFSYDEKYIEFNGIKYTDRIEWEMETDLINYIDEYYVSESDLIDELIDEDFCSHIQEEFDHQYFNGEVDLIEMECLEIHEIYECENPNDYPDECESAYNPKSKQRILNDENHQHQKYLETYGKFVQTSG